MIIEIPKQRNVAILPQFAIVGKSSYHAARVNVSRNAFLNSRSAEKTFSLTFIHLIPKWRRPRMVWVELHKNEASRATEHKRFHEATLFLTEDDIPGSLPDGRDAIRLKNSELKFWLKCRGDSCKGLSTKAQLCKR